MSHYIHVFVDAALPLEDFVQELSSLLGIEFVECSQNSAGMTERWYEGGPPGVWLDVFNQELESFDEMPLREYSYHIRLQGSLDPWRERERRLYEYAKLVFGRLQEHGKYRVLMTDELDKKLEEFTPTI